MEQNKQDILFSHVRLEILTRYKKGMESELITYTDLGTEELFAAYQKFWDAFDTIVKAEAKFLVEK